MKTMVYVSAMALFLAACSDAGDSIETTADTAQAPSETTAEVPAADTGANGAAAAQTTLLDVIVHERRDENRARDAWRHPAETLSFFELEPDMTIAEVLPGNGGWYSQILTPFTAEQGRMIGLAYPYSLWTAMFPAFNEENYERFGADITQMGRYMSVEGVQSTQETLGYALDDIPDAENGQIDAVLFFRALHHLFRFEDPLIDTALAEIYDAVAPGGVVGVVQHRAPESADAAFANGDNGYLKQSDVIAAFEQAGFVLDASSEINANPNDPADGFVWRLPPTSTDNPETLAIGESDRMTLRFRKPA